MPARDRNVSSGVFGPSEIANLTAAYSSALSSIQERPESLAVSGHELRRQIASQIIAGASRGEKDPELLAEAALAALT